MPTGYWPAHSPFKMNDHTYLFRSSLSSASRGGRRTRSHLCASLTTWIRILRWRDCLAGLSPVAGQNQLWPGQLPTLPSRWRDSGCPTHHLQCRLDSSYPSVTSPVIIPHIALVLFSSASSGYRVPPGSPVRSASSSSPGRWRKIILSHRHTHDRTLVIPLRLMFGRSPIPSTDSLLQRNQTDGFILFLTLPDRHHPYWPVYFIENRVDIFMETSGIHSKAGIRGGDLFTN